MASNSRPGDSPSTSSPAFLPTKEDGLPEAQHKGYEPTTGISLERQESHGHNPRMKVSSWVPFYGMARDIRARIPWYASDWTDAWNYRVIPSTWFIFFANVLPGLAFSLDLIENTHQYGVQEVLLSSFMAAFVASFLGGQPLLISGVTGPITVFNKTIYDIFEGRDDFNYLHFMGWVYLWGAILHWVAAAMNVVKGLKFVTRFSCDTFGFYVAAVYVQYGIQTVTRQFHQSSTPAAFLGLILALVTLAVPHYFTALAGSGYINKHFRRFCSDYGMPITIVAATGLAYWGRFNPYVNEATMTLPTTNASFQAANDRPWLVRFWHLDGKYVGLALPFGIILFILFYFDANVSWYMGTDALLTSGVTQKMLYLIRDPQARSPSDPLNKVRKSRIVLFTLIELVGFGATFAITQTIAAVGFPVIIMLLVPVRLWIVPHLGFRADELAVLDGAVASPFTMESVGG
ncbi:hypothetical protein Q8F55_005572 [Vanrija albida]|uniref:Bicarbonate transporter-like transmembrane domain-containing protein n=1 Tax=Vanrija albida TaxID=181172 RepID=A0ABR3Q205_9TREE